MVPNELKDESKETLLEKEKENLEKVFDKKEHKKRSLLLPLESSIVGILLLLVLGSFM